MNLQRYSHSSIINIEEKGKNVTLFIYTNFNYFNNDNEELNDYYENFFN